MFFSAIYNLLTLAALPFALLYHWYRSISRGRKAAIGERLGLLPAHVHNALSGKPVIWMHAVSVGEVIAARPLIRGLRHQYPDHRLLLSVTTETGRGVAERDGLADAVIYFPFDFPPTVRHLLDRVAPKLIIIMETEIWPVFIRETSLRRIPVMLANGRISDRSFPRYKRFAWFFHPILAHFRFLGMQSAADLERLVAIGAPPDRTRVLGNLKYDIPSQQPTRAEQQYLRNRYAMPLDSLVFTAASTHPGEEQQILAVWRVLVQQLDQVRFILVPRHPERAGDVAGLITQNGFHCRRRTSLAPSGELSLDRDTVLLVDTVGELTDIYQLSDLVFVGGSLVPTGGHNLLEPAAAGIPSLFGPNMDNFREVAALVLDDGAGVQVADQIELQEAARDFLLSRELRHVVGANGLKMMRTAGGATQRYLDAVAEVLAV
jgi:3-deoxy-D-manno-octulosonic-acid transferase